MKNLVSSAVTKTGRRSNNQDNFMLVGRYAPANHDTFSHTVAGKTSAPFFAAVCDGMGGEEAGEVASFLACSELARAAGSMTAKFDSNSGVVTQAVLAANDSLCRRMKQEQTGRMGSTVAAVLIQDNKLFFTNLGDSRIYLLRKGRLVQLTRDHTEGQGMVDAGVLTPDQLKTHPSRNKLNRHLGIFPEEMLLECPVYNDVTLQAGDRLLLCSDGVSGALDDNAIVNILSERATVAERAEKLVDSAYSNGSRDNMTALVVEISGTLPPLLPVLCALAGLLIIGMLIFVLKNAIGNNVKNRGRNDDEDPEPTELVTDAPTDEPEETEPVTEAPVPTETEAPTDEPTEAPTEAPTDEPTEAPVEGTEVSFYDAAFERAFRGRCGYDGIVYESDLLGITQLDLSSCELSEIADVARFPNLTALDLSGNEIDDISALGGLTKLTTLDLRENPLGEEQIAWLRQQLSNCSVIF